MKQKKLKTNAILNIGNLINQQQNINVKDKTFEKLMLIYAMATKELTTKISIWQDEFKILYQYDLIDHVNTRIKKPESILQKMQKRNLPLTYQNMIENINDIAGVRIVCPLKKDIFSIRDFIKKIPGVSVLKEKDYVTHPKKSGYSSYHLIVEVPVVLSQANVYVKIEIQIRTIAMDFWASLEHKMKYKSTEELNKKQAKEWVNCAKIIHKLDNQMMLLNNIT